MASAASTFSGGVDVAVGHAPAQCLGRLVDQLDLVGGAHDLVGDRLLLADAGDPLDDVVQRLEVLDVDRRDDVDPRVEEFLDVLPALLVAIARDVGVSQLVDEDHVGAPARTASTSISSNAGAAVLDRPAGHHLEVAELLGGARAAVGLDEPDDHIGAALARDAGPR